MAEIHLRRAEKTDGPEMAQLIDMAGDHIPSWIWQGLAEEGQTPLEVGAARAARDEGGFSYRHAVIAEVYGVVAGMMLGYRLDDNPGGDVSGLPPLLVPLIELESELPGGWYLNALATFSQFRRQGVARSLLQEADGQAAASGASYLGLIVNDNNASAMALYEAAGYERRAMRPVVPADELDISGNWALMTRQLDK